MGEISEAFETLQKRKLAGGATDVFGGGETDPVDVVRRASVGMDIDLEELVDLTERLQPLWVVASAMLPPGSVAGGALIDGLMTGLLVAERRVRGEGS